MNYEELLESRNGSTMSKEVMPFGLMYKKMVDGKYVNSIDLREDLKDSLVFCDAINTESEQNKKLVHKNQLHFVLATDSAGLYAGTDCLPARARHIPHLLFSQQCVCPKRR